MAQVDYRVHDGVAVLSIDNPPVNAMAQAVRAGIIEQLARAGSDAAVRAVVLIGRGKTFVAGADIREFGKPPMAPSFPEVMAAVEGSAKPVVAALHGNALGGGLELALSCHYRVGLAALKAGLPEVNLGLLPGAGGTQRLPRLIGPEKALDMILSGQPVSAAEALRLGFLDHLVDGHTQEALEAGARAFALHKAQSGEALPRASQRQDRVRGVDPALFDTLRRSRAKKWAGQIAQLRIVDCVQAACERDFAAGSQLERSHFLELQKSPQSAALRYAFFIEREAAKIPGLPADAKAREIHSAAVIGAGTMGVGIAMCLANAGIPVQLLDASPEALDQGLQRIRGHYASSVARGSTVQARADQALALITGAARYEDIADADLVIEAVFENLAIKQEVFAALDRVMKPGAILASNTSTLSIDALAAATRRPQDVIGTHFFSPAHVMRLQENVRGAQSGVDSIATVMALAKRLGKVAVLAGNAEGFIGNRILQANGRACDFLVEDGATPWQVDRVLEDFGFAMGLYRTRDLAGLDVGWRIRQGQEAARDRTLRYSPLADRLCEQGRYGQKTGAGYYRYAGREATPDAQTDALVDALSAELGIQRRAVDDAEILDRVLCAMANEGARIVGEGVAIRASDVDLTYLYGYGFPRHQGGPMYWAERQGLAAVLDRVQRRHASEGAHWRPAPLLLARAAAGGAWSDA